MAITQTKPNKAGDSPISTETTEGVLMQKEGAILKGQGSGDPNGLITAPKGSRWTDVAAGIMYINTDGSTAWNALTAAQALSTTPTVAGTFIAVGNKQYVSAYHLLSVAGTPYQLNYGIVSGKEYEAVAPATLAFPQRIMVPVVGGTVGLQWFQIGGEIEALVDGTADVAAGDFIRVINAGVAFIVSTGTATVQAIDDSAMAVDAQAADSAVSGTIILLNNWVTVAAS